MAIEKMLVEHCSATLASIKTANLFSMDFTTEGELESQLEYWNRFMKEKGIGLFLLRVQRGKALIYVYRKKQLQEDLRSPEVAAFLEQYGYEDTEIGYAVEQLRDRFLISGNFPHEIGVFLDYPLGDVEGFIVNNGQNYKYSGLWKVYCNENETRKVFLKYQKCKDVYKRLWNQGRSIMQLTVAA